MARMSRPTAFLLMLVASFSQAQTAGDSSHVRAREEALHGHFVSLESILKDAERRQSGRLIEVELDMEDERYEIEILRSDGQVVELEYDARTGRFLGLELDD